MRQSVLLPLLLAALLPLTACARAEEAPETPEADGTAVKQVRLVDTAQDGSLIVAGEARGDVLTLSPDEVSILWDGVERSPEALRDGPGRWPGGALFRLEGSADTGVQVCCWTGTEVIWRCSAAQDAAGNWSYRTDSAALACGGSKPNIPKGGPPV